MKKYIVDFFKLGNGILTIFALTIFLSTWFYISYTGSRDIDIRYNGIKYQAGNLQSFEPIIIEIKGSYSKRLFSREAEFNGTIKLWERVVSDKPIKFNKYKMGVLDTDDGIFGMIFISDMFEKLTIEIHESNQKGGHSWNSNNGWLISGPCNNRGEAVEISNILEQRLHRELVIK